MYKEPLRISGYQSTAQPHSHPSLQQDPERDLVIIYTLSHFDLSLLPTTTSPPHLQASVLGRTPNLPLKPSRRAKTQNHLSSSQKHYNSC